MSTFVPVIFPEFTSSSISMLTIRNMPPLAFGIHNEQYDCGIVLT